MSQPQQLILGNFRSVFKGYDRAYGQHEYGKFTDGQKEEGGKSWTVKDTLLRQDHFESHLAGKTGLGIIPITKENKCKFMVADIDIYDKKSEQLVIDAIIKKDLPLVVFYSKSRGYHLYLFFKEFIAVKRARALMERFIRLLSIDILCKANNREVEIFPKQMVMQATGTGSWINLPYYGALTERGSRQTMLYDDRELAVDEALVIIQHNKTYKDTALDEYLDNLEYNDAPPCLQSLFYLRNVDQYRNNFLFSFGVYFKKQNEDSFEQKLYTLNKTLNKPLPIEELDKTVIASIRKKGYGYKCSEPPCNNFCNKTECKNRTYGIGDNKFISELDFGTMYQYMTDPPYYEWDINNKSIRFKNEDEFLNQNTFRRLCVRHIGYAPYKLKDAEWIQIVNGTLANMEKQNIDMHEDISPGSMLREYFREFILDLPSATNKHQVNQGRVYYGVEKDRYYFRPKDLIDYIYEKKRFRHYTETQLHGFLKDVGCRASRLRTDDGKSIRVYYLPGIYFKENDIETNITVPEINFTPDDIMKQNAEILDSEEPF